MINGGFNKDRFREAMGDMSSIELADRLSCPKSSVSMYLSGQREPSKMAVQLIALNLGVNPAWLYGLDVPKFSNAKIISRESERADQTPELSPDEAQLLSDYRSLSKDGKRYILQTVTMAKQSYAEKNNALSDLEKAN